MNWCNIQHERYCERVPCYQYAIRTCRQPCPSAVIDTVVPMNSQIERDTSLHLVLGLDDHEALTQLLQLVRESDISARTENILQAGLSAETSVTINLDMLTSKQRETLELALETGYYERPRETDLTALADELDISKSAVSQRLRTAETKLIRYAFEHHR